MSALTLTSRAASAQRGPRLLAPGVSERTVVGPPPTWATATSLELPKNLPDAVKSCFSRYVTWQGRGSGPGADGSRCSVLRYIAAMLLDSALGSNGVLFLRRHRRPVPSIALGDGPPAAFEYLEIWHNRRRSHSALGWRSPIEFENQNKIVVA